MNQTEAITLCRLAKAMCPQQALDEFTPEAWHMLLEPYRFDDAKQALVEHCREHAFVAPAEIIARIRRLRQERIRVFGDIDFVPAGLTESETRGYIGLMRRRIADGEITRETVPAIEGLKPRDLSGLGRVFPRAVEA